jgi:hypothetical protein
MNNANPPIITGVEEKEAIRALTRLVAASFKETAADTNLRLPPPQTIRAGLAGGLPFDGLTTDLFLGCLPASQICYGSCFAAKEAFAAGYDFTHRVPNILNEDVLRSDLRTISSRQGFLRNGWNSDPSWDWERAARVGELVAEAGKHPVFLTKAFLTPDEKQYGRMAAVGAELRICISAFDTDAQLRHRFQIMHDYREHGGLSVPVVMTAAFKDEALNNRQARIVDQVLDLNLPGAENSIRFNPRSRVMSAINPEVCGPVANTGDLWAGRIYSDKLTVPTLSSVSAGYRGVQPYRSQNSASSLEPLFADPVPTHAEILGGAVRGKPVCAGVPMAWQKASNDVTPK